MCDGSPAPMGLCASSRLLRPSAIDPAALDSIALPSAALPATIMAVAAATHVHHRRRHHRHHRHHPSLKLHHRHRRLHHLRGRRRLRPCRHRYPRCLHYLLRCRNPLRRLRRRLPGSRGGQRVRRRRSGPRPAAPSPPSPHPRPLCRPLPLLARVSRSVLPPSTPPHRCPSRRTLARRCRFHHQSHSPAVSAARSDATEPDAAISKPSRRHRYPALRPRAAHRPPSPKPLPSIAAILAKHSNQRRRT